MSAGTRISGGPLSTSLLGNETETNLLNSIFNKPDDSSFNEIANETHVVSPAVLENRVNVTDGPCQPGFSVSHLGNMTEHALLIRIQVRTS